MTLKQWSPSVDDRTQTQREPQIESLQLDASHPRLLGEGENQSAVVVCGLPAGVAHLYKTDYLSKVIFSASMFNGACVFRFSVEFGFSFCRYRCMTADVLQPVVQQCSGTVSAPQL